MNGCMYSMLNNAAGVPLQPVDMKMRGSQIQNSCLLALFVPVHIPPRTNHDVIPFLPIVKDSCFAFF